MTYAVFLFWFLILPAFLLMIAGYYLRSSGRTRKAHLRRHWLGVAILACIAFLWTTPWDNYLIFREVWDSPPERIMGRIGYVPLEEYAFFIWMPIFNGAVFFLVYSPNRILSKPHPQYQKKLRLMVITVVILLMALGVLMLSRPKGSYLGLILVWFTPPLAIQWLFDPATLIREKRTVIAGTLIPLLYFAVADRFAIQNGIWEISKDFTTGITIFELPIEEFFFFFVTSLLLAQGMVLWHCLKPTEYT
jgi:lycopene beta-cyclase